MASQNGHGGRTGAGDGERRRRRNLLIAGVTALAILAFGGGILLAQDDGDTVASPSPTASRTPDPTEEPTTTPSASPSESVTPSASASASPVLEQGRHFVYLKDGSSQDPWSLTFDLAYFYEDQEAIDECGPDVPNGYCIVNDNAKLRTLPVTESVTVRYIPTGSCCALKSGSFPPLAEAVNGTAQTDYDPDAPYWITVQGGQVIRISQQFLP